MPVFCGIIKIMEEFIKEHWIILFAVLLWSALWKGIALWKAARLRDLWWFAALFIVNTVGILEILYIFVFSKRSRVSLPKEYNEGG